MAKHNPLKRTVDLLNEDSNLINMFKYNQFSEDIEFSRAPCWDEGKEEGEAINDDDLIQLRYYITSTHDFEPTRNVIGESCFIIGRRNSYHPIKRYIEKQEWDGVPRLDEWLIKSMGCDDNIYIRMLASKFLIAAVNRIYNPGCKFDHMMILEGAQSIGKSTLVEELSGSWYVDTNFDNKDKDLVDLMRSGFLIEISELSGMSKKDVDWLKSFLTRKVDRVRLPYAARTKDFKRKCVFIGTYNPSGNNMYLRDDTGNRRFYPVECKGKLDLSYIKEFKHQLWAEAYKRYLDKEIYYINDPKALEILKEMHGERELETPTHNHIRNWVKGQEVVEMDNIIKYALKIEPQGKKPKELLSYQTIIGMVMRKLKWTKGTNNNRHKYYCPDYVKPKEKEIDWDE